MIPLVWIERGACCQIVISAAIDAMKGLRCPTIPEVRQTVAIGVPSAVIRVLVPGGFPT